MADRVHTFGDDALADHDATALAAAVHRGEVSPAELADAAAARARQADMHLNALAYNVFDAPRFAEHDGGDWYGVPTFVKDNTDIAGMPTGHGSAAFQADPATREDSYTRQFLSTGVTVLGKTRLPEFGLSPSTEFQHTIPVKNPWNTAYSVGGSSGGAAALVAAGVVPIAHGNDGGGSLRIPAACAGLVGLKTSRYRQRDNAPARQLPIRLITEGVLTRTVRDTAAYLAAAERYWHNPKLAPIGMVTGAPRRPLRIGLLLTAGTGDTPDEETRAAVEKTAALLEHAGHRVEPVEPPFTDRQAADFLLYWALLAQLITAGGRLTFGPTFDRTALEDLTRGLSAYYRTRLLGTAGALLRLRHSRHRYQRLFQGIDVVLSPVLTHTTPPLGYLEPNLPTDELLERLTRYVGFTPIANVTGAPAISIPAARTAAGLPVGVMLSAAYGGERVLLELAYQLEAEQPFPRIDARHPEN